MAYRDTFVQVAEDCPATRGEIPASRGKKKTIALIEYELLSSKPYSYSQNELIFETYVRRNAISTDELAARGSEIWDELFKKEHPCLRASALTKRYGWGAHYNADGKIALYAMDSEEYGQFVESGGVKLLMAMRAKRKAK